MHARRWWEWVRDLKRGPNYLRVYAVTDPDCNARQGRTMLEAVRQAIEGGATIVQLREKETDAGAFVATAREALALCRQYGVPLVINDRVDVCLAVGADGVHVGQSDIPAEDVRRIIGPDRILGVSTKTPDQVQAAFDAGADYVGAGAVYPTTTKKDYVDLGLARLEKICAMSPLPVVAIGGIKPGNIEPCMKAGAVGVAVVSGIFDTPSPAAACQQITREGAAGLGIA